MGSRRAAAAAAAAAAASCCRVGGDRPNAGLVGFGLTTVCGGPRFDAFSATGFSVGEAAAMAAKWTASAAAAVLPVWHGGANTVAADGGGVGGVLSGALAGVRSSDAGAGAICRLSLAAIAAAAAAVAAAAAAGS